MTANWFSPPSKALDANASPYSGAQWFFYQEGTTTPQAVFADSDLATSLGAVVTADASGTFGYFRIYGDGTSTAGAHVQGTCGTAGDMVTDSASVTAGQSFTVNTFTLTAGNA